jgi:hypothetical protein
MRESVQTDMETLVVELTIETYSSARFGICLCKPRLLILSGPWHILRTLHTNHQTSIFKYKSEVVDWPLTTVSHSLRARAFVVFLSVSSSRRERVFIDIMKTVMPNKLNGYHVKLLAQVRCPLASDTSYNPVSGNAFLFPILVRPNTCYWSFSR